MLGEKIEQQWQVDRITEPSEWLAATIFFQVRNLDVYYHPGSISNHEGTACPDFFVHNTYNDSLDGMYVEVTFACEDEFSDRKLKQVAVLAASGLRTIVMDLPMLRQMAKKNGVPFPNIELKRPKNSMPRVIVSQAYPPPPASDHGVHVASYRRG